MKRRTKKKRAMRWFDDEMKRMRRSRDRHYAAWSWIEIARALIKASEKRSTGT
jgi:hypothetical protein